MIATNGLASIGIGMWCRLAGSGVALDASKRCRQPIRRPIGRGEISVSHQRPVIGTDHSSFDQFARRVRMLRRDELQRKEIGVAEDESQAECFSRQTTDVTAVPPGDGTVESVSEEG